MLRLATVRLLNADAIPGELKAIDAWVVWRYEAQDETMGKPAFNARATSERAWPNDPETWSPFYEALNASRLDPQIAGIGIVLSAELGIVGIDLDHVSEWPDEAWRIVRMVRSYTELSPSGDGYRIFCYAEMPDGRRRRGRLEMYGAGRIFTVTGHTLGIATHLEHRQDAVDEVFSEFLEPG